MCRSPVLLDATQHTGGYHVYRTDAIAMQGSDGVTLDAGGVLSHVEGLQPGWLTGNNPLTSGVITSVMIHIYDAAATNTLCPCHNLGKDT